MAHEDWHPQRGSAILGRTSDKRPCARCGLCCYEKFYLDDERILITDVPCEHLDVETRLCRIFPERRARNPRCLSAQDARALGVLPASCPYVQGWPDYKPPLLLCEHPEYADLVRDLFAEEERQRREGAGGGEEEA